MSMRVTVAFTHPSLDPAFIPDANATRWSGVDGVYTIFCDNRVYRIPMENILWVNEETYEADDS